jgi:hypothetical protein
MVKKRVLVPTRLRKPPRTGFFWVDRRFLKAHGANLSAESMLLYFFLTAVSDKNGMSFYSDSTIALRLRMDLSTVHRARDELQAQDLVAYCAPLTQVLSLPEVGLSREKGPQRIDDVLRELYSRR